MKKGEGGHIKNIVKLVKTSRGKDSFRVIRFHRAADVWLIHDNSLQAFFVLGHSLHNLITAHVLSQCVCII